MKILNIIWKFSTGGIGKCFMTYASLADIDKSVKVISVCIDPQNCSYDRTPLRKINATMIPIRNKLDFSWIKKTKDLIDTEQPDCFFCHGFNGPVVVEIIRRLYHLNTPMVCSYHGLYHAPTINKKIFEFVYNHVQTLIYKKYAEKVILVENYSKSYLAQAGVPTSKMVVVHNGIPEQNEMVLPMELAPNGVSIGLASRMDSVKGIEYLLKAVPYLKENSRNKFHVYILGDGPLENKLKMMANRLGIQKEVSFLGYQNNIPEWLAAWDIFVLPSLHEYHSIALLEAMRAGKAIVATNVGGNEESITNQVEGLIVSPKDSMALASAIQILIDSKKMRDQLGNSAKKRFMSEFTEDIMKKNLVAVFKALFK